MLNNYIDYVKDILNYKCFICNQDIINYGDDEVVQFCCPCSNLFVWEDKMYVYIGREISSAKFIFYAETIYYFDYRKTTQYTLVHEGKILELLENKNPLQLIEKITNNIIFK